MMPLVSRVMVRTALLHLGLGATIGGLMLLEKAWPLLPWLWLLRPGHIHLMILGWTVQLAMGVAVWILPRFSASGDRGNLSLVWWGYGLLNSGVLLVLLHQPSAYLAPGLPLQWMLPLAGLLELSAMLVLGYHVWRRVLPFREVPRPNAVARR